MKRILMLLLLSLWMVSCDDEEGNSDGTLELNISGLESLGDDFAYEGWLIVNGNPVSTGTFTVDGSNNLSQTEFEVDQTQLNSATMFVLSIEPVPDPDPAPAATKYLSGAFNGNSATLSSAPVGNGFEASTGRYIVAAPTGTGDPSEEFSGIWFLDNSSGTAEPGLDLPSLEPGWKYEGWVVLDGTPLTTGTFLMPAGSDDAAPFSGTMPSPPFPGEDLLVNAPMNITFPTDLRGQTAVISIEPDPDNSPAPFTLKPLVDDIPLNLSGNPYPMQNNTSRSFPTGFVTR